MTSDDNLPPWDDEVYVGAEWISNEGEAPYIPLWLVGTLESLGFQIDESWDEANPRESVISMIRVLPIPRRIYDEIVRRYTGRRDAGLHFFTNRHRKD